MLGDPQRNATWQPTRDFVDPEGPVTEALLDYVTKHKIDVPMSSRSTTGRGDNCETSGSR